MTYTLSEQTRDVLEYLERLRRIGYTSMVGVSDKPDTIPHGPVVPAYSRAAGPLRSPGVRR